MKLSDIISILNSFNYSFEFIESSILDKELMFKPASLKNIIQPILALVLYLTLDL
jgi:hypothetical protein